jgi:uncharacterized protein (DUF736 family)
MSTGAADQQTFNNELRGALFRNDKGDNPARPDYRGNCQINGQKYRISAWLRTSRAGQTFMSMAFTLDQTAPPDPQAQQTAQPQGQPQTEDVPF